MASTYTGQRIGGNAAFNPQIASGLSAANPVLFQTQRIGGNAVFSDQLPTETAPVTRPVVFQVQRIGAWSVFSGQSYVGGVAVAAPGTTLTGSGVIDAGTALAVVKTTMLLGVGVPSITVMTVENKITVTRRRIKSTITLGRTNEIINRKRR